MTVARVIGLAAILVCAQAVPAQSAAAQEPTAPQPTAQQPVTPNTQLYAKIEQAVIKIHGIFGGPVHPIISGVGPGSGWGAGVGFTAPGNGPWKANAKAIYTLNKYYLAEAVAGYDGRRTRFELFGRGRDMTRLDYFGPGNSSNLFDRTDYRLRDPVVGGDGDFRLTPWLTLGARVEELWPDVRSGQAPSVPSIEQRFTEAAAPGLTAQPRFGRYQGSAAVTLPAPAGEAFYQGTKARVTYAIYDDQTLELFNFKRVDIEAQQTFAGFRPHHRLTLSGWTSTSTADASQQVPFYLQPTLGGKSSVSSVNDTRLGSDGTDATLRGYRNLRFSDRNLLLLQGEYRVPIWGPVDATVFADAGKVTPNRSDLDLTDLRRDFGFSLSIMKGWETWARMDVGFGSGEGARVYFTLGSLTP